MTLGSHQRCVGKSQTHFTPRWILDALGTFHLDPCAGDPRPWDCATDQNWTEGGLDRPWPNRGFYYPRVWMNPPFNRYVVGKWLAKLADHGNGIALLHARTETDWFEEVWNRADAILFLADRIKFCDAKGVAQPANSGAPVVLVAYGEDNVEALRKSGIAGFLVPYWHKQEAA